MRICFAMTADLIAPSHGHPPIRRRQSDIIAGQDFLSVFMSASGQTNAKTTTEIIITTPNESPLKPISRDSRSSLFHEERQIGINNMHISDPKSKTPYLPLETMFSDVKDSDEDEIIDDVLGISNSDSFGLKTESKINMTDIIQSKLKEFYTEHQNMNKNNRRYDTITNDPNDSEAQVIAVRVSSSVGISQINKLPADTKTTTTTTENISKTNEQNAVASSEDPIINAQSNKSEFTIEEREPATRDKDYIKGSATNRHSIVAPGPLFGANEAYLQQQRSRHQRRQEPVHPYHQTIIYHNSPKEGNQPRSISYSSVGQSVHPPKAMDQLNMHVSKEYEPNSKKADNINMQNDSKKPEKQYSQPAQVHSEPAKVYSEPEKVYGEPAKVYSEPAKNYGEPAKVYSEPAKIYSEPAKIYSEPEKVYSEPAKIYSEPAKVYSEPAKVYSEPAKIYSEPAKVYSQPEKLYQPQQKVYGDVDNPYASKMEDMHPRKEYVNAAVARYMHQNVRPEDAHLFGDIIKKSYDQLNAPQEEGSYVPRNQDRNWEKPERVYGKPEMAHVTVTDPTTGPRPQVYETTPEQNYEVDEAVSVMTNGRVHGVQPSTDKSEDDSQKSGYVVEGKNFRKYRVEERTSDGFIVGEYGVVSHDDGSLRGVRYTADGTINPRLIYDTLMKFLAL